MKNCIANGLLNNLGLVECYKLSGSGCFPGSLTGLTHLFVFTDESRNEMRHALFFFLFFFHSVQTNRFIHPFFFWSLRVF